MKVATKLYLTVGALVICFLLMLYRTTRGPLVSSSSHWPGIIHLLVFVGLLVPYAILFIRRSKEKKLPIWLSYLLLLMPIVCFGLAFLGLLGQSGLFLLSPLGFAAFLLLQKNKGANSTVERCSGCALAALLISAFIAHENGYKLYGYTYLYRKPPPGDSDWIKVNEITSTSLKLESYDSVAFTENSIPSFAFDYPQTDLAVIMFQVPIDDLYVRKDGSGEWQARYGNFMLHTNPHFLPGRLYGYYESSVDSAFYDANFYALKNKAWMDINRRLALLEKY
ncbi:hypothetical protein IEN85_06605 [Pelagicoccus sp. NFK12]|uniref:Uncharacterized protein n=1 Tax=Pelagicoccus enzymogenes TaxID=2773457 RepID=A0A927IGY4_9BACT|nr:hypothetical protein [Pelagicoccus enzymogenes]MBD5779158.1 hypothetical protein [Pelagicoccus enzymogenes]